MSFTEFWQMGGDAYYVWMSFGVTCAFMVGELIYLRRRRRNMLARLQQIQEMESE